MSLSLSLLSPSARFFRRLRSVPLLLHPFSRSHFFSGWPRIHASTERPPSPRVLFPCSQVYLSRSPSRFVSSSSLTSRASSTTRPFKGPEKDGRSVGFRERDLHSFARKLFFLAKPRVMSRRPVAELPAQGLRSRVRVRFPLWHFITTPRRVRNKLSPLYHRDALPPLLQAMRPSKLCRVFLKFIFRFLTANARNKQKEKNTSII